MCVYIYIPVLYESVEQLLFSVLSVVVYIYIFVSLSHCQDAESCVSGFIFL